MSYKRIPAIALYAFVLLWPAMAAGQGERASSPRSLLPQVPGWTLVEPPRSYFPGTLFEYIDGAAESYLSYAFQELVTADFKSDKTAATLTVEVYDMGSDLNAFGIFSSERYPGSPPVAVGNLGYLEEGTLNFIVGPNYIKLICFDGGAAADSTLKTFAEDIDRKVPDRGSLPPDLALFPKNGLVEGSEKFILQNVLGYDFLHDGYLASYRAGGREFELFIVAGRNADEAANMLERYLAAAAKNQSPVEKTDLGYHVKDRYARNVFLAGRGRYVVGIMRLEDGGEAIAKEYLGALLNSVKG
jgi:hypothetical protein